MSAGINACDLVKHLGGHWRGNYGFARCPLPGHGKERGDREPSLKIIDGDAGVVVHCFAGCDWRDVKAELRRRGLLPEFESSRPRPTAATAPVPASVADPDREGRSEAARDIWRQATPITDTLGHDYLLARKITIPPPPSLRFANLVHGLARLIFPCMVAGVQNISGDLVAVHRTFLQSSGNGKANVSTPRMALGPITGGAVRLGPPEPEIGVCEGIETGLSVAQLFGAMVWCCLGGSNMKNLALPDVVERIRIYGDNDNPGHRFAEQAAEAFHRQGRKVKLIFPTEQFGDFNDVVFDTAKVHAA